MPPPDVLLVGAPSNFIVTIEDAGPAAEKGLVKNDCGWPVMVGCTVAGGVRLIWLYDEYCVLGLSLVEAAGYGPVPTPPVRSKRFCIPLYPCEVESKLSLRPEGDR